MLDGRVLGASQVEYKPFGKPPTLSWGRHRRGADATISGLQASKLTAYALQSTVNTSSEVDSKIAAALLNAVTTAALDAALLLANSCALSGRRRGQRGGGRHREQIPGPTDVSLSNWTVRPSSGCSVVLTTHATGVSVDGYTLTLAANPWNIVRTYNLTPGRELLFACRYRLGTASNFVVHMSEADNVYDPLYGSFAGDQGAWSTAKMYFTVPFNGVAKLHFGAHFQAPGLPNQTAGTVDVYGLQILDATLETGNAEEEDTAASALLLKHEFLDGGADDVTLATLGEVLLEPTLTTLVRSNSQSSVAGFQLEGYAMTLSAFAWHIVRTYTLTPGRRYSFGCRYRQRGRQRLRGRHRHLPRHGLAGRLEHGAPGLAAGRNREAALRSLRRVYPRAGAAVGGHAGPVQHADQGHGLQGKVCLSNGPAGGLAGPYGLGRLDALKAHWAGSGARAGLSL